MDVEFRYLTENRRRGRNAGPKVIVEDRKIVLKLSPSVVAATEYIKEFDVKTINADVRERLVTNPEMSRMPKTRQDNIIEVISLKKSAEQAIVDINNLYMRGFKHDKKD